MNVNEIGKEICNYLALSSHRKEALEIESLISVVTNANNDLTKKQEAIDNLLSRCHPRWLGDYYIDGITYKQWTDLITRFKNSLNKMK